MVLSARICLPSLLPEFLMLPIASWYDASALLASASPLMAAFCCRVPSLFDRYPAKPHEARAMHAAIAAVMAAIRLIMRFIVSPNRDSDSYATSLLVG